VTEKNPRAQRGSGSLVTVIVKTDITFKDAVATTMLFRTHGIAGSARARCAWPGTVVALQADAVGSVLGHFRTAWDPVPYLHRSPSPSTGRRNATVRKRFSESLTPLAANASAAPYGLRSARPSVLAPQAAARGGKEEARGRRPGRRQTPTRRHQCRKMGWPSPSTPVMAVPRPRPTTLTSSGTALVNDIIAPLHFAHDPMQQAGSDRFVLAKLRRDVLKKGFAAGYGFGCLHQPVEIVVGEAQSKLIERGHSKLHTKNCECRNRTLVQTAILPLS